MVHKVFLIFETDMISEFERHKKQFQYSLWCENHFLWYIEVCKAWSRTLSNKKDFKVFLRIA